MGGRVGGIIALFLLVLACSACGLDSPAFLLSASDSPAKVLATSNAVLQKVDAAHFETLAYLNDGGTTTIETTSGDDLLPDQSITSYTVKTVDRTGALSQTSEEMILETRKRIYRNIHDQWYYIKRSDLGTRQLVDLPRMNLLDLQRLLLVTQRATLFDSSTDVDDQGQMLRHITAIFPASQCLPLIQSNRLLTSFFQARALNPWSTDLKPSSFSARLDLWIDSATGNISKLQLNFYARLDPASGKPITLEDTFNATITNINQPAVIAPPADAIQLP